MIFKNNSEYIIPFVIKDSNIFKYNLTTSYVDVGVLYNYLYVDMFLKENVSIYNVMKILKNEPCFNSVKFSKNRIIVKFIIDKNLDFLILPIINNGYEALTKDMLKDCILFWKDKIFEVLCNCKKTLAARKSSQGLFFIYS